MKLVELSKSNAPRAFSVVVDGSKELSTQVQKYLFETLDATWAGSSNKEVRHADKEVLFVEYSNFFGRYTISYGDRAYLETQKVSYPPVVMSAEIKVTLNSIKVEVETIEIDGKEYAKDQILSLLASNPNTIKPL